MAKIIILEGPDGGGKTTLARHLVAEYGYRYVHCGVPKLNDSLLEFYTAVIMTGVRSKRPTVIDRCYLGETVYGEVMRDGSQLDPAAVRLLQRLCKAQGVLEFICLPPFEVALANWAAKESDYVRTRSQFLQIYSLYEKALTTCSFLCYDYTAAPDLLRTWTSDRFALPAGCVGSLWAQFLVVGEVVNQRRAKYDLPFYALNGSSAFLNDALRVAEIAEVDLAFTNAVSISGLRRNLRKVKGALLNFQVALALGKAAERACQEQRVPHPAYYKRFNRGDVVKYGQLIKEACANRIDKLVHRVA